MKDTDIDVNMLQMMMDATRQSRPRLDERRAREAFVDLMARLLHYQDSGEPDWMNAPAEALAKEYAELPQPIIHRYQNDAKFHAQVNRAVAAILDIIERTASRR